MGAAKNTKYGAMPLQAAVSVNSKTIDLLNGGESAEEDAEVVEYTTDGTVSLRDGIICVEYAEPKNLGMGNSKTALCFDPEKRGLLTLSRSGGSTVSMTFDSEVRRQNCALNAAGAGMIFSIYTKRFVNGIDPVRGGSVELDYLIEFRGVLAERVILRIDVNTGEARDENA